MKLLVVDPYDKDMMSKLKTFSKEISTSFSFINDYEKISNIPKETYLNGKMLSNSIFEVVVSITSNKVTNLCQYKGNKDNKLVELKIKNLSDRQVKNNEEFILLASNYAFTDLGAETVTILSNDIDGSMLSNLGFESLGLYDNVHTYVKDKQDNIDFKVK